MPKGEDITTKFKVDISDLKKGITEANSQIKLANSEFKKASAGMDDWSKSSAGISAKLQQLKSVLEAQTSKLKSYQEQLKTAQKYEKEASTNVENLRKALDKAKSTYGANSTEVKKLQTQLNAAEKAEAQMKTQVSNLTVTMNNQEATVKSTEAQMKNLSSSLKNVEKAEKLAAKNGTTVAQELKNIEDQANKTDGKVGKLASTLAKGLVAGAAAAAAGLVAMTKSAISNYAEYEQLVGGVDTLFKESSNKVQQYAANAYKNQGMSANDYMETVTSFSASLLQSLGNDTSKAADVADMALTDMADNANKMGTAMGSIQDAYQGFAKQNYTMLDNLKLGYGGTKTEMERLLADAQKISGVKYDISNLSDIYNAIHVIQGELGITGTTAKEAATTIQGSASAMKSAWGNLMTGLADDNADLDLLINNFIDSVGTYASNLIPRIQQVMSTIGGIIRDHLPEIAAQISTWINNLLNDIISNLPSGFQELATAIKDGLGVALNVVKELFGWIIDNGDVVISLLAGIAAGFVAFKVASTIMSLVKAFNAFKLANEGATVAQWLLNAAMTANPAGLIALAIGALIGVITLLILNWDKVKEAASACWEAIKSAWNAAASWFNTNIIQPVQQFFTNLWNGISTAAQTAWDAIVGVWTVVSSWFDDNIISPISGFFEGMWNKLKDGAAGAWEGIKSVFSVVTSWFKNQFTNAWTAVKNVFSTGGKIFDGIKEGIASTFKTVVNGIISGINRVIKVPFDVINGALNTIRNVGIGNAKPFSGLPSISVPQIPQLERGIGLAKKGHQYLLEGKGNEAVVPLDRNKYWIRAVAKDMLSQLQTTLDQGSLVGGAVSNASSNVNNYTQIINAPKQPSRIELYRDTKNLLALGRG